MDNLAKYKQIGQRIKNARKEVGLMQSELAGKLGLEKSTMSLVEKGLRKVKIHEIEKIAKILNRDIEYFVGKIKLGSSKQRPVHNLKFILRADDNLSEEAKKQVLDFVDFVKGQEGSLRKPNIVLAKKKAKQLLEKANFSEPPVSLSRILKKIDCQLDIIPFDFNDEVSGVSVSSKNKNFITYNKNQHIHRQRFTVAHELGHLLLGHTSVYGNPDLEDKNPSEIEANKFAAELLMPSSFLKVDVKKSKNPKILARKYWVSEEAMWWRLIDLNLIDNL